MSNRSRMVRWYMSSLGFLVLAAVLLAGVAGLSQIRQWRIDLTQDKLYTLSDGSRHIVTSLQEPITLTLYYSASLAQEIPALDNYATRVREIFNEYVRLSDGKLKLEVVQPEVFSPEEDEAAAAGLTALPNGQGENIYFGLVGGDADKQEVIGFFNPQRESLLEYEISQMIFRLGRKAVTVEVISGLPVFRSLDYKTNQVRPPWVVLDQLYKIANIRQKIDNNIESVEPDVDLLLVVHPRLLPEKTLYAIDQYVMKGGKLLVFVDPVAEMDDSEASMGVGFTDRSSTLEQLFIAWGISYDPKKVLLDLGFAHSIPVTQYGREAPHVGVLGLHDTAINRSENVIAELDNINLASAGALQPREGATTRFVPLLSSSEQSQLMDAETYVMIGSHDELLRKFQPENRQYAFAALVSGQARTAFPQGKPQLASEVTAATGASASPTGDAVHLAQSVQPIQVMVVADTDVLSDRMWVQVQDFYGQKVTEPFAANGDMVTNMVEALTGSIDLISLRSRGTYQRPFTRVDELEKAASSQFQAQQESLMNSLADTEKKINELRTAGADGAPDMPDQLSPEQQAAVIAFQKEKQAIRKNLREVQRQLNKDVDQLGFVLKVINISAVPVLLTLLAVLVSLLRTRRARRA